MEPILQTLTDLIITYKLDKNKAIFSEADTQNVENIYDGWMKNPKSEMISCNDGFRPVSFLIETMEEEAK